MKKLHPFLITIIVVAVAVGLSLMLGNDFSLKNLLPKKEIGLVEINGTISESKSTVQWIDKLINDDNIPVILVRINSPGGGVVPSYEIYEKLMKAKENGKKIVVSMGSLAASGGYMIACAGDIIMANPGSITGSIGVILEAPDFSGLMKKLGIKVNSIKSAKYKDIGSPYRPMKPDEEKILKGVILDAYDQFVEIVANSRGLELDSVRKIADGRIFTGRQALEIGLVDTLGTMDDAIKLASKLAGINGEPSLKKKPRKKTTLLDLLGENFSELTMPFRFLYLAQLPSR